VGSIVSHVINKMVVCSGYVVGSDIVAVFLYLYLYYRYLSIDGLISPLKGRGRVVHGLG